MYGIMTCKYQSKVCVILFMLENNLMGLEKVELLSTDYESVEPTVVLTAPACSIASRLIIVKKLLQISI